MKLENSVRFTSHRRPFLVRDDYCDNPDCKCNDVFFEFTEIDKDGSMKAKPLSFGIRVDLDTWEEQEPPQRPERITEFAEEFLRDFPTERRAEFQERYKRRKRVAKRLKEYRIEPEEVENGTLISYSDVVSEKGAVSHGGSSYSYAVKYDGREYLVEDLYCPNPRCNCSKVQLLFLEAVTEGDEETGRITLRDGFMAEVTFDERLKVVETFACSPDTAQQVLSLWREGYDDELGILKKRYEQVKKIGERSVSSRIVKPVAENAPPDNAHVSASKPRRNDRCPCGSGKKYKRCCGRKTYAP
jgi:hypothetical protein